MKAVAVWVAGILLAGVLLVSVATVKDQPGASASSPSRPELEYLKAVNRAGPSQDPRLLFLLMGQYASANLHREGAEFFSALLKEFEPRLSDAQKSLYLAAVGVLRAGHANDVALLSRIGWVKGTVAVLEEAKRLSGGEIFVVRWMAGVVSAQLPGFFGRREASIEDLTWCLQNIGKAPHPGWLREVYYQLASLERKSDPAKAQAYLRLTGYAGFDKPLTLTTPFAEDPAQGHTFSAKRIAAIIPGTLFVLSGFEFSEHYFVVSDDGRQLIGIDAGVRPDSARDAYEALRAYAPALPELTTVFVTHAHWDHVGGHRYFRDLSPRPTFYASANYREELARSVTASDQFSKRFFGERFSMGDVRSFKPDATVDRPTELKVGGTRIELIPVQGGETNDALLIHLPDHGVMFVGDFVMPYFGAPFVEEGNIDGMLDAIDIVVRRNPRHLLHGHEPLTRIFDSAAVLSSLKSHLTWLRGQVAAAIQRGAERAAIHQANLIPPGLLAGEPRAHLPYLLMRENLINRVYDQSVGYWQADLQGVDHLGRTDRGSALVDYFGISERQLAKAVERMIADGKYELAAATLDSTKDRFPESGALGASERLAYLKLMEKYQDLNPFKFIIYSAKSGMSVPPVRPPRAARGVREH